MSEDELQSIVSTDRIVSTMLDPDETRRSRRLMQRRHQSAQRRIADHLQNCTQRAPNKAYPSMYPKSYGYQVSFLGEMCASCHERLPKGQLYRRVVSVKYSRMSNIRARTYMCVIERALGKRKGAQTSAMISNVESLVALYALVPEPMRSLGKIDPSSGSITT